MIFVRPEQPQDYAAVYQINAQAFEGNVEAQLVEAVREAAQPLISLVAVVDGDVVGHILFSPVTVGEGEAATQAMGLGPMAVLPDHQNKGIGSQLIQAGLQACRQMGEPVVFVLGHEDYYPRFGFEPAASKGLRYQSPQFDPYFMVIELRDGALNGRKGYVTYHPAFDETV